jgi:predicted DNA-binding WGR domain protein
MYFHPLQEELDNMSDEELGNRIRELTKKLTSSIRFGRNPDLQAQIKTALAAYQETLRQKRLKGWVDNHKKNRNEPDLGELINID